MVNNLDVQGPMRLLTSIIAVMSRRNAGERFDRLEAMLEEQ